MNPFLKYCLVLTLLLGSSNAFLTAHAQEACLAVSRLEVTAEPSAAVRTSALFTAPVKTELREDMEIEENEERTSLRRYLDSNAVAACLLYDVTFAPDTHPSSVAVIPFFRSSDEPLHLLLGVLRV